MPGSIVINPSVFEDKRDALAVAWDEALRLFMEDTKFEPEFEITPEQEKFFRGTAYAEGEGTSAEKGGDVSAVDAWRKKQQAGMGGKNVKAEATFRELVAGVPVTEAAAVLAGIAKDSYTDYIKPAVSGLLAGDPSVKTAAQDIVRTAGNRAARRILHSPTVTPFKGPVKSDKDFSPEGIQMLRVMAGERQAESSIGSGIDYLDYPSAMWHLDSQDARAQYTGKVPGYDALNQLGGFTIENKGGVLHATDVYDWNKGDHPGTLAQAVAAGGKEALVMYLGAHDTEPDSGKVRYNVPLGKPTEVILPALAKWERISKLEDDTEFSNAFNDEGSRRRMLEAHKEVLSRIEKHALGEDLYAGDIKVRREIAANMVTKLHEALLNARKSSSESGTVIGTK